MNSQLTDRTILVGGKPPLLRRPDFWAKFLSEVMDVFAFLALLLSGEVRSWPIAVAAGLGILRATLRFRIRTLWMFVGFVAQVFFALLLCLRLQYHPLVASAHIVPIALASIGLTRNSEDLWGWRMGLGFISLILASALSPDFSVMVFILLFVVAGSVSIACRFLDQEFIRRGVIGSLPKGFIRSSFKQTGILFLSALVIFPLLPRVQGRSGGGFGSGSDPAKTGYTEEVNLTDWNRPSSSSSSAIALRIYGPDGRDPAEFIPAGLLRSRVLSILTENGWDPQPVKINPRMDDSQYKERGSLKIVREMIGTPNLPVPYGTFSSSIELYGFKWRPEKTMSYEWSEARSRNQRFTYTVSVSEEETLRPQDKPTATDLRVPEIFQTPRMKSLAARLFKNLKDTEAKTKAVTGFFRNEGFSAADYDTDPNHGASTPGTNAFHPIERFLFLEKSGHCELFSSSMAILLRMAGVPTRLIAGFRVSRNAFGDVLTVRQADAHAWLEVYYPKIGWRVFDPTPRIFHVFAFADWVRDSYDWTSAKWSEYILNYGEGENSLGAQWEALKRLGSNVAQGKNPFQAGEVNTYLFFVFFAIGAIFVSFSAVAILRAVRRRKRERKETPWVRILLRERKIFEALLQKKRRIAIGPSSRDSDEERIAATWFKVYDRARFGAIEASAEAETLSNLRLKRAEIEKNWKTG